MTLSNTPDIPGGTPGGGSATDVARESGREVGRDATDQAQEVAGTAREEASNVVGEAKGQLTDLAVDAREQLHQQAREQTDHLGEAVEQFGNRIHALADGRPEEAGPVADYLHRVAGRADDLSGRIQEMGFDGMIDETQKFARRRPGMFLLGAATAGFAMSRLARGAHDAPLDDTSRPSHRPGDGRPDPFENAAATRPSETTGSPSATGPGQGQAQPSPGSVTTPPPPRSPGERR